MTKRLAPLLLASALALLLAACGGPTRGALQVTIEGLPEGVNPRVEVTGPGLTEPRLLEARGQNPAIGDLEPGQFTLTPREVGSTVRYSASASTADVVAGRTTEVTVTYTPSNLGTVRVTVSGLGSGQTTTLSLTPSGGSAINRPNVGNGVTTFSGVPAGTYTLSATAPSGLQAVITPSASVSVSAGATAERTVAFTALSMTVTLAGLPDTFAIPGPGIIVTATQGSNTASTTFTGTERSKSLALPAAGNYALSATGSIANIPGTYADTGTLTPVAPTGTVAAGGTATVTLRSRSGSGLFSTGRLFVAGNGAFSNGGRSPVTQNDAGFSVADASIILNTPASAFESLTGGSNLSAAGLMRIAFDTAGNLYAMYQNIDASNRPRIVRITAANLAAGNLSPSATGNTLIDTAALGGDPEPADMAFDASGNLWVATDSQNRLICISATAISAGGTVSSPSANLSTTVSVRPQGDAALNNLMANIHAIAFDAAGNLWFTSGDFRPDRDRSSETPAVPGEVAYGRRSVLARINAAALTCSGGSRNLSATDIPVRLDISNESRRYVEPPVPPATTGTVRTVNPPVPFGTPFFKPVAMVFVPDPDGSGPQLDSLWIGDFGGGNGASGAAFLDANTDRESVIQVPLSAANTAPTVPAAAIGDGFNLRFAEFGDRITVQENSVPGAGVAADRGMQQVFGLALDRAGRLWVATNNNVEVPATRPPSIPEADYNAAGPTERRGKLYAINLTPPPAGFINTPRPVIPFRILTAPADGIGFVGIAVNQR